MRRLRLRATRRVEAGGSAREQNEEEPAVERTGARAGRLVAQEELQQDLQRFAALLSERVTQATQDMLGGPDRTLFEPALRHTLIAISAALDIAAGPRPEVNLLDMVVFVTLSRDVLERHYVPQVFGEAGQALANVFRSSERQIWEIARKVLTSAQERDVRETIRAWQASHPEQTRVAGVRFTAFSAFAADRQQRRSASGILAGVQSATRTADAALLLGERAMFLAPRIPAVLRLQARLGAHELLCDSLAELDRVEALLQRVTELSPMLHELTVLVEKSRGLAVDARHTSDAAQTLSESALPLLTGAERLLAGPEGEGTQGQANRVQKLVEASDGLVLRTQSLVQDLREVTDGDPLAALRAATDRLEQLSKRLVWHAALVGTGLILLFWLGYALTVRR